MHDTEKQEHNAGTENPLEERVSEELHDQLRTGKIY